MSERLPISQGSIPELQEPAINRKVLFPAALAIAIILQLAVQHEIIPTPNQTQNHADLAPSLKLPIFDLINNGATNGSR